MLSVMFDVCRSENFMPASYHVRTIVGDYCIRVAMITYIVVDSEIELCRLLSDQSAFKCETRC